MIRFVQRRFVPYSYKLRECSRGRIEAFDRLDPIELDRLPFAGVREIVPQNVQRAVRVSKGIQIDIGALFLNVLAQRIRADRAVLAGFQIDDLMQPCRAPGGPFAVLSAVLLESADPAAPDSVPDRVCERRMNVADPFDIGKIPGGIDPLWRPVARVFLGVMRERGLICRLFRLVEQRGVHGRIPAAGKNGKAENQNEERGNEAAEPVIRLNEVCPDVFHVWSSPFLRGGIPMDDDFRYNNLRKVENVT